MSTVGDYATVKGNMVRWNRIAGAWQVLYRPGFPNGGPMRVMNFDSRDDAVLVLDKMEQDGNAR